MGLLPGLVIYTVSYQFVSRSIEAWFDVPVAGALDAGLALGKSTLDALQADLAAKTRWRRASWREARSGAAPLALERLREQPRRAPACAAGRRRQVLVTGGSAAAAGSASRRALAAAGHGAAAWRQIEGLDEEPVAGARRRTDARARSRSTPSPDIQPALNDDRFLMVVQRRCRGLARNALAVQAAYSEYQQRAGARRACAHVHRHADAGADPSVFGAVLLAFDAGQPAGAAAAAAGRRRAPGGRRRPAAKPVFASRDELGGLTRSSPT